jgi:pimeloyl-ACP methyl ester carboxylesterase
VEDGGCYHGGSGPPVLLLHSGFGSWVEWRSVIELLTPRRTVLAPTLPGSLGGGQLDLSARTMLDAHADHVEELLDAIGWTEPIQIVGSSY